MRYSLASFDESRHKWIEPRGFSFENMGEAILAASALLSEAYSLWTVVDHQEQTWAAQVQGNGSEDALVCYNDEVVRVTRLDLPSAH